MKLLRELLFLKTIYFKQTTAQILMVYIFGSFFVVAISLPVFSADYGPFASALIILYIPVLYMLIRTVARTILVNRYLRDHHESIYAVPPAAINNSSIAAELDGIDRLDPIATYDNAQAYVATFNFYRQTKNGEYLAKQAYYVIMAIGLERRLPHILFDSKVAKNQQFKYLYLKAQRISVQGPFDEVFDSYVPETYAIDSLSFVTPEIMETLLAARQYDIEIVDDKLLLYAPLIDDEEQQKMAALGNAIAVRLNRNIDTYRDDRLTGVERQKNVTLFGRSLMRSPVRYVAFATGLGLVSVGIITYAIVRSSGGTAVSSISLFIYFTFATNVYKATRIILDNRRSLEQYHYLYQTDRGKPISGQQSS